MCKFYGHYGDINALSFAADEQVLVSGGYDGSVKFWDLKQKLNRHKINSDFNDGSQNDRAANYSGLIADYANFSDTITCLIAKEHYVYAGCLDGSLMTLDIRKGEVTKDRISGTGSYSKEQKNGLIRMDLLKDNKSVILGTQSSEVKLFNTQQGSVLNSYTGHTVPQNLGASGYLDVKTSKDNSYFISGSSDGCLYM